MHFFKDDYRNIINIIIINPLTARVVWGTTDDFTTSFLLFSLFSTALWNLANSRPVRPFPDVVFPPLLLSALSSFPFHCALPDEFGQT